jgi:putative ABC transport system permease protein
MIKLALKTLRHRKGGFAAAFIAMFFASALITACGTLLATAVGSTVAPERYAGAAVLVTHNQTYKPEPTTIPGQTKKMVTTSADLTERVRLDAGLAEQIRGVPGVTQVVPEISFPAAVQRDGQLLIGPDDTQSWGHSWTSAALGPFSLREGDEPAGGGDVVIDAGLAQRSGLRVGDQVTVQLRDGSRQFRVTGVAGSEVASVRQAALFFAPAEAQRIFGEPGKVDAFGVIAAPGTDSDDLAGRIGSVVAAAGGITTTGTDRGLVEFPNADTGEGMIPLAATFGGVAMIVATIVVVGTFTLSVQQRRREIGLLRAVGTRPGQLRRMLGGEALIIAVIAAALGIAPGILLSRLLFAQLRDVGTVPASLELQNGPVPAFVAIGAAVLTALVATLTAAHRATRIRPTEVLGEAALERKRFGVIRLVLGTIALAGSVVMAVLISGFTGEQAFESAIAIVALALVSFALLAPVLARLSSALLGGFVRKMSAPGYLAAASTRGNTNRLAASITPLMLAIGFASSVVFMQTTNVDAIGDQAEETIVADHVLVSAAGGLPPEVADAAARVPGVRTATGVTRTSVVTEYQDGEDKRRARSWSAQAVTPRSVTDTIGLQVLSGSMDSLPPNGIALSAEHASLIDAKVGDALALRLGDGTPATLSVVAVYDRGVAVGDAVLAEQAVAGHTTTGMDSQVLIRSEPGADTQQGLVALARQWPGLRLADKSAVYGQIVEQARSQAWTNYLLAGAIALYTAIAVVNTLVMATANRSREFALLRAVGAKPRDVLRMTRWENLIVVLSAAVLGTVVAVEMLVPLSLAVRGSVLPAVPLPVYLAILAGTALLGFLATETPARLALRRPAVDEIGSRE